jgi:hypothetical protein
MQMPCHFPILSPFLLRSATSPRSVSHAVYADANRLLPLSRLPYRKNRIGNLQMLHVSAYCYQRAGTHSRSHCQSKKGKQSSCPLIAERCTELVTALSSSYAVSESYFRTTGHQTSMTTPLADIPKRPCRCHFVNVHETISSHCAYGGRRLEIRTTMICRGRFAYYPDISETSTQHACGRCSYPVERLLQSSYAQSYWLVFVSQFVENTLAILCTYPRGRSLHRQGTGRRGQCLYPRLWSDVGATYSFDQEGEYARI